jgi:hypothetical protein
MRIRVSGDAEMPLTAEDRAGIAWQRQHAARSPEEQLEYEADCRADDEAWDQWLASWSDDFHSDEWALLCAEAIVIVGGA